MQILRHTSAHLRVRILAMLGAAFLVKETAILFVPLPLALGLVCGFDAGWKRAYSGWLAGFTAVSAWWWVWVYAHTGDLYLVGPADGGLGLALGPQGLSLLAPTVFDGDGDHRVHIRDDEAWLVDREVLEVVALPDGDEF